MVNGDNGKRPGIFSETQRIQLIGMKMKELAGLMNNDEAFAGRFPVSDIADARGAVRTRIVTVNCPSQFIQLDGVGN
jgi:hypothetical protein